MESFLKKALPSQKVLKITKLSGDGGHRSYKRILTNKSSFILMDSGKNDPSLKKFIEISKRLEDKVRVPKNHFFDLKQGFLLLEDLGDISLEQVYFKDKKRVCFFYKKLLKELIKLSQTSLEKKDLVFNKDFFKKENEFAIRDSHTYINRFLSGKLNRNLASGFLSDMEKLLDQFKAEDQVFCHRDFHSRNIMMKKKEGVLIDFQDAGIGPLFYDLTSLIYDCYVPLNDKEKKELIQYFILKTCLYL